MNISAILRLTISALAAAFTLAAAPASAATVSYQFPWATEPFVLDCATLDYANPYNNFIEPDVDYSLWSVDPATATIFMNDCIAAQAAANTNTTTTTVNIDNNPAPATPMPSIAPTPTPASAPQVLAATTPATLPRTGVSDAGFLWATLLGSGGALAQHLRLRKKVK